MSKNIAFFISPHGYGHATRSLAVMAALRELDSDYFFHIFSRVPKFLLDQSIAGAYRLHELDCDIGLVQKSALEIDLDGTLAQLADFLPFEQRYIDEMGSRLESLDCSMAICDISPLGIAAGKRAGLPVALIENFTWDWIYKEYLAQRPDFATHIRTLERLYVQADIRIQTAPACQPKPNALQTAPVMRKLRLSREEARAGLRVKSYQKLVVVTMGGLTQNMDFLRQLNKFTDHVFVFPGLDAPSTGNLRCNGELRGVYHPDLLNAADAVVGKLGYSTVAEVYQTGAPFGYIERANFRESPILARFIRKTISGVPFSETGFINGWWLGQLRELLALRRQAQPSINGADQIAQALDKIHAKRYCTVK